MTSVTTESYGMPTGTAVNYKALGFPKWVDDLCLIWGLDSSTYPGHQEGDRPDIGAAPNPDHLNRGIDWAGPPEKMLAFARWLLAEAPPRSSGYGPPGIEMIIYRDLLTGEDVVYPPWVDFSGDLPEHTDHVHTRFSAAPVFEPPAPHPSSDQERIDRYARIIITEGRKRLISRKGICIALTVPPVETGWRNLANTGDLETQALPNDGVGADHDSAGLFQQRQAWGPASCRMDPACSAGLFFDGGQGGQPGLRALAYDTDAMTPGQFAADVQEPQAEYRYRYDEHWDAANALFDRLTTAPGPELEPQPEPQPEPGVDQMIRDIWHGLFDLAPSTSRYGDPEVTWNVLQLIRNDDGFAFDAEVENNADLGDPWSVAQIKKKANAGNPLAKAVWDRMRAVPGPTPPGSVPPPDPTPPAGVKPVLYCVNGFQSDMWVGPPADVGHAVEDRFYFQPIGYESSAFPLGVGRDSGVAELKTLIREHQAKDPGRGIAFFGFSLGAVIVDDVFDDLRSGDMQEFWSFFLGGAKIGDPRREAGVSWGGPLRSPPGNPPGRGIAGSGNLKNTPDNFRSFVYPANYGDIYTNAGVTPLGTFDQGVADDMQLVYDTIMTNWDGGLMGLLALAGSLITRLGPAGLDIIMACFNGIQFLTQQQAPHVQYELADAIAFLRSIG